MGCLLIHNNFNPRSPCGERQTINFVSSINSVFQSTLPMRGATLQILIFSPSLKFQSTLPMRGATCYPFAPSAFHVHFNPRSPCGERPRIRPEFSTTLSFQSTLPMRGATSILPQSEEEIIFQSTLPMRGATRRERRRDHHGVISIHAPHAGSDFFYPKTYGSVSNFNPRSPCGERLQQTQCLQWPC